MKGPEGKHLSAFVTLSGTRQLRLQVRFSQPESGTILSPAYHVLSNEESWFGAFRATHAKASIRTEISHANEDSCYIIRGNETYRAALLLPPECAQNIRLGWPTPALRVYLTGMACPGTSHTAVTSVGKKILSLFIIVLKDSINYYGVHKQLLTS